MVIFIRKVYILCLLISFEKPFWGNSAGSALLLAVSMTIEPEFGLIQPFFFEQFIVDRKTLRIKCYNFHHMVLLKTSL
jgi:hypothetical protein